VTDRSMNINYTTRKRSSTKSEFVFLQKLNHHRTINHDSDIERKNRKKERNDCSILLEWNL